MPGKTRHDGGMAWTVLAAVCLWTAVSTASLAGDEEEIAPATRALLQTFADEFVKIEPGTGKFPATFRMGSDAGDASEGPAREVRMSASFWIAKYEVPQNLYEAVMGNNPSRWKGARNSVELMTHAEAVRFCEKITTLLHRAELLAKDEIVRLPSEAEWEYCCRAGTTTTYSFGDAAQQEGDVDPKAKLLDKYAWHTGNAAGNDPPVGALAPNPWGLYDMHGYLWEFCADDWVATYEGAPHDTSARTVENSTRKVIRGGSWKDRYPLLRSAARKSIGLDGRDDAVGFRCVRAAATE